MPLIAKKVRIEIRNKKSRAFVASYWSQGRTFCCWKWPVCTSLWIFLCQGPLNLTIKRLNCTTLRLSEMICFLMQKMFNLVTPLIIIIWIFEIQFGNLDGPGCMSIARCTLPRKNMNLPYSIRMYWTNFWQPTVHVQIIFLKNLYKSW